MSVFVSTGWHDKRLLVQQPPHRLTRVHGGNTRIVGSLASDSSANFRGTDVNSGKQFAGFAILPADRSTPSPPKRAAKYWTLFSLRMVTFMWFNQIKTDEWNGEFIRIFNSWNLNFAVEDFNRAIKIEIDIYQYSIVFK